MGSRNLSIICATSFSQKKRLIQQGVNANNIIVTGLPDLDELFSNKKKINKNIFYKKNNLKFNHPLIVLALPPWWEHGISSKEKAFEVHCRTIETIKLNFENLIISLHPKMNFDDYTYLEKKYKIKIFKKKLQNILQYADIFIVNNGSTTALWASVLHIFTILIDFFDLRYKNQIPIYLLRLVNNYNSLNKSLRYIKNKKNKKLLRNNDKKIHLDYKFDGNALQRIIKILN